MKSYFLLLTLCSCGLPFCSIGYPQNAVPTANISQMKQEIDRLEAICVPKSGTSRKIVESQFGPGQPTGNSKVTGKRIIPESSPYRSYTFCPAGTLFVCYDKHWKVRWADFANPYGTKGRPAGATVSLTEQLQEVRPRLAQMQRIYAAYRRKFHR